MSNPDYVEIYNDTDKFELNENGIRLCYRFYPEYSTGSWIMEQRGEIISNVETICKRVGICLQMHEDAIPRKVESTIKCCFYCDPK